MSEVERVYTIPLRDAYTAPRKKRAKVAVRIVRDFIKRHMKVEVVKISPKLNEIIWSRSAEKPPRRVKVRAKVIEEGVAEVEPAEAGGS
ncbi:MAG: 50S ribosomal protein L31e [Thermoprotei archaeon]|nr:MAG: 50S ribosomal protein L31e [Thermoprotei archaeon]HDD33882.1 50S ribosomal protein L31e [Thermofilaceae archaeon]